MGSRRCEQRGVQKGLNGGEGGGCSFCRFNQKGGSHPETRSRKDDGGQRAAPLSSGMSHRSMTSTSIGAGGPYTLLAAVSAVLGTAGLYPDRRWEACQRGGGGGGGGA